MKFQTYCVFHIKKTDRNTERIAKRNLKNTILTVKMVETDAPFLLIFTTFSLDSSNYFN